MRYGVSAIKQALEVKALQRRWNHSEVRQHRITASYIGRVEKDSTESVAFGHRFHQCSGIGYRYEILARAVAFDFAHSIEKIFVEHQRLGRRARLARHDEKRVRQIN